LLFALIELTVYGLLAGTLLSQLLRDVCAVALLCLLVWERWTGDDGESALPRSWIATVGAFVAANLLSAWMSDDTPSSFEQLRFYPLGGLIFLGTRRLVAAGRWPRLTTLVLVLLIVFSVDTIWQSFHGQSFLRHRAPMWGRFQGGLVYPSDISLLAILLPIGAATLLEGGRWRVAVGLVAVVLVAAAVSFSGTRSAWMGLLLIAIAAGWIHRRAAFGAVLLATVLAVSLLSILAGMTTAPQRLFSKAAYRAEKRVTQWQAAVVLFREAPVLGHGPHSFRRLVRSRHGESSAVGRVVLEWAPYPHNIYLEALSDTGVLGLGALLALLGRGFTALYRRRRDSPVARVALVSLGLFAVIGAFDMSLVKDWVQLCFWLPLGIASAFTPNRDVDAGAESAVPPLPR
jgi:O-antigen ligase